MRDQSIHLLSIREIQKHSNRQVDYQTTGKFVRLLNLPSGLFLNN